MQIFSPKRLLNWLKVNSLDLFFTLVILLVTSFIAFKNYTPNTYLTGWDNLHPEFNFKLNIERSLNAVWQEYQGVGLLGGMAHAADLPRQVILAGLSFFIPINFIRYFWTFLMLFIGPLGVYFLVSRLNIRSSFLRGPHTVAASQSAADVFAMRIVGFVSSMFYLFNLATVQYFFVPFETFTSFFGFLPWLIYFAYNYLTGKKGLLGYALISILAIPAFYVQTLFVVYMMLLSCLIFFNNKQSLLLRSQKSIWLFLTTFLVNSFWLLPVIYFILISGGTPSNSKINSIATPETYYMNLARNDFSSIATFKGYWFDYYDWNSEDKKFDYLYKNWEDFSSKKTVQYIGIGLFLTSVIGLVLNRQLSWILMFIVSFIMIFGVKIPIPILSEAFRNSFTKWSVALSFVTSIGIGLFLFKFKKLFLYLFSGIIIALSVYHVLPIFSGNLISQSMRINIPSEYFLSFDFLNSRTNGGRVAILPVNNFWGWQIHSWGYRGSGFYWYGIKNPILDRAFDVWSKQNENFYEELNFALLSDNMDLLENVFDKYQVTYIYNDKNIITPQNENNIKADLSRFKLIASFGNIDIYETGYFGDYVSAQKMSFPDDILKVSTKLDFQNMNSKAAINEWFNEDQGYKIIENCDLFKKGSVERQRSDDGNLYIAKNGGVACDYYYYSQIDNLKPFVMHIKGKNIEGRSLKFYIFNSKSKRVVAEELLPEGDFDNYFLIKPIYFDSLDQSLPDGYTVSVETRSFGTVESQNLIEKIEIYQVELPEPTLQGLTLQSNLEIRDVKKWGTAIYKVETTGSGVLQLGQGYEKGWTSYPKSEHVKINSWANGWKINANSLQSTDYSRAVDNKPSTVVIFYWPQFMEWFGFVVLCIVGIGLAFGFGENKVVNSR